MSSTAKVTWIAFGIAGIGLLSVASYSVATEGPHLQYLGIGVLTLLAAALAGSLLGFLFGIPKYVSSGQYRFEKGQGAGGNPRTDDQTQPGDGSNRPDAQAVPDPSRASTVQPPTNQGDTSTPARPASEIHQGGPSKSDRHAQATEVQARGSEEARFEPSTNLAEVSDWLTKLLLGAGLVQLTQISGPAVSLINSVAAGLTQETPPGGAAKVAAGSIMLAYSVWGFIVTYIATTIWYSRRLEK